MQFRGGAYNLLEHLPSPVAAGEGGKVEALMEIDRLGNDGRLYELVFRVQREGGDAGLATNIVLPYVMKGPGKPAYITNHVILNDPEDCERIGRAHLRKQPNFQNNGFKTSLISTDDDDYWRKQREHLAEAFLPMASLAKVLPVSAARAKACVGRLGGLAAGGSVPVDSACSGSCPPARPRARSRRRRQ